MKVLLVSGSLPPLRCGVGDYTLQLARALARTGRVDIRILTSRGAAELDEPNIRVLPIMPNWRLAAAPALSNALKDWSPDVLHIQYPTQGFGRSVLPTLTPLIAHFQGVKVVRTWHEHPRLAGLPRFLLEAAAPGPYITVRPDFEQRIPRPFKCLVSRKAGGFVPSSSSIPKSNASDMERRELRSRYVRGKQRLIVFFGFLYPFKGVEQLFEIADPERDHLVIAGEAGVDPAYTRSIRATANDSRWRGSVTMLDFLPDAQAADLLAAADAVILPFRSGGGVWNSSIQAAVLQGTVVITTSKEASGLDGAQNIYFSAPDDVADMRSALNRLAGQRRAPNPRIDGDEWEQIAREHLKIYGGTPMAASAAAGG